MRDLGDVSEGIDQYFRGVSINREQTDVSRPQEKRVGGEGVTIQAGRGPKQNEIAHLTSMNSSRNADQGRDPNSPVIHKKQHVRQPSDFERDDCR